MILLLLIITGAILGSFFNLVIYRLPRNESIILPRSHCIYCQHPLGFFDLIPLISFLILRRQCRYCHKPIPIRYFLCELLSIGILLFCWMQFGIGYAFVKTALFLFAILVIFFTDLETYIIPNVMVFSLLVVGLGLNVWEDRVLDTFLGMVIGFLSYFLVGFLAKLYYKKEAIGGGDMKLGAAIGAYWGVKIALLTWYLSFLYGGIIGLVLILLKKKGTKDIIPFGPSIILGFLTAFQFKNVLICFLSGGYF